MPNYEYRTVVLTHGLLGRNEDELDRERRPRGAGVRPSEDEHDRDDRDRTQRRARGVRA